MNFEPIGFLESCYVDKFGTPRQPGLVPESWAKLRLERRWQPEQSLQGLEGFSHLWLVFVFHKNENERFHAKVHPPRLGGESQGVFSTRSPHRPNPIGLSLVKIEKIESDALILSGADLIDGTPILDIKPYLPEIESHPEARAGWTAAVPTISRDVRWSSEAQSEFLAWAPAYVQQRHGEGLSVSGLQSMIENSIALDPRPVVYRGQDGKGAKYRQDHAIRFFNIDVQFHFESETLVWIDRVVVIK